MGSTTSSFAAGKLPNNRHAWVSHEPLSITDRKWGNIPISEMRYSEKFCNPEGGDYRGRINWTRTGSRCQVWNQSKPHWHDYKTNRFPNLAKYHDGQKDSKIKMDHNSNYCRTISTNPINPAGMPGTKNGWNEHLPNDGIHGSSGKSSPWCFAHTDRLGNSWDVGTNTLLFDSTSDKGAMGSWVDKFKSYNLFKPISNHNRNGHRMGTKNTGAQRCWVAHDIYQPWDCHDAATTGTQKHGNTEEIFVIDGGSFETIEKVTASGGNTHPSAIFKKYDVHKTGSPINIHTWTAKPKSKTTPQTIESLNHQEHWIRIELPETIDLHKIYIADSKGTLSSAPIQVETYESPVTALTGTEKEYGYTQLSYGKVANYKKKINAFNNVKSMTFGTKDSPIDKPVRVILITFPRSGAFNNNFGITQVILERIYHNYELNYNKNKTKFELFDYSGYVHPIIEHGKTNIIPYTSGYGINFISGKHFKVDPPLPIKINKVLYQNETDISSVDPITMISCWFKKPFTDTGTEHVLVCDSDGTFMPCVIHNDQNRLGCIINNKFKDSGIRIGELKNGWHYLMIFCTKTKIYYYLNGTNESSATPKYSGECTSGVLMNNIYIIGNSTRYNNPWGIVSNLNIFCNWNKRYNDIDSNKVPIKEDDGDFSNKMNNYVSATWSNLNTTGKKWKDHTCPDHSKTIQVAVNTAKARAVSANRHKLDRYKKTFKKTIKSTIQEAEDKAYKTILDYVADSSNVIIWNNVNMKGKTIELITKKTDSLTSTDLGIRNIQVYGNYNNEENRNWITDINTVVKLSSQPNSDTIIDIENTNVYRSIKSKDTENSKSMIKCPANEHLISCKCWSPDGSCKGSKVIRDEELFARTGGNNPENVESGAAVTKYACEATNKQFGSGVYAQAKCAKFTGSLPNNTFKERSSEEPGGATGLYGHAEIGCDDSTNPTSAHSPYYMVGCSCYSENNSTGVCDGSEIELIKESTTQSDSSRQTAKCKAYPTLPGGKVKAQALCIKVPGLKELPNVSQKTFKSKEKSGTDDDAPISLMCPPNYKMTDGDCNSADGSCDGAKLDSNKEGIVAYNKEYGNGVYATANCMQFNIIDDNCIDGNLDTECRTGKGSNFPSITFTFSKQINIYKIVIYNREKEKENNMPLHINIKDDHDHIVMTGVKETYSSPIKIINTPPNPPNDCKGFDELNITDKGYALIDNKTPSFRQWTDIRGIGKKCDYCRVVGTDDKKMISCALGNNTYNQYAYNSIAGTSMGESQTQYMYPESNDTKSDFCYLKRISDTQTTLECLRNTSTGFGEPFNPTDQDANYSGLTGDQILQQRQPLDTSKCIINTFEDGYNTNKVDAGFYWPKIGKYFLFKNSILDSTNVVIFTEINAADDTDIKHEAPLIMNTYNWKGVYFDKLDATLYLDMDPLSLETGRELVFFFNNKACIKYDLITDDVENKYGQSNTPNTTINDYFKDLQTCGFDTIDAACYLGNGLCLFFSNNRYLTYNIKNIKDNVSCCGTPSYISQTPTFSNLPFTSGIDCIICFHTTEEKTMLFFKDDQYIEYDHKGAQIRCSTRGRSRLVEPGSQINDHYINLWDIQLDISFIKSRTMTTLTTEYDEAINRIGHDGSITLKNGDVGKIRPACNNVPAISRTNTRLSQRVTPNVPGGSDSVVQAVPVTQGGPAATQSSAGIVGSLFDF